MNRVFTQVKIIAEVMVLMVITSCNREIMHPFTGRPLISDITTIGATAKSVIIWDGDADIKECGFCWNTTGNPLKSDSYVEAEPENERFNGKLKDLSGGTKYYVRSYAINKAGIFYGEVIIFSTTAYKLPEVYSPYINYVSHNSVICSGGRIISDNTYDVLSKGICWSTSKNPTINDELVDLGSGFGSIGSKIEGLMPSTVYYFRAYATNLVGTTYGSNQVAKTFDGYTTDFDGHVYSTVLLGKQEWMNRNLETMYFSNGDIIKTTGTPTLSIEQENNPVYQWPFLGFDYHVDDEGRLYTWYAATDSRKICPAGWHIPSIGEWNELLVHLGGETLTYGKFKGSNNYNWASQLAAGATEGSFNAQLAGFRTVTGQFQYGTNYGTYWWSATEASSVNGYSIYCGKSDLEKVIQTQDNKKNGYSVRCVKD